MSLDTTRHCDRPGCHVCGVSTGAPVLDALLVALRMVERAFYTAAHDAQGRAQIYRIDRDHAGRREIEHGAPYPDHAEALREVNRLNAARGAGEGHEN